MGKSRRRTYKRKGQAARQGKKSSSHHHFFFLFVDKTLKSAHISPIPALFTVYAAKFAG
jgi:hypothetical protein